MSSVAEKSTTTSTATTTVEEKRSFFLRSESLEKIKCSAKYPFRLAGIALSKAAVIELVEELIIKSRIQSQKAFLIVFIAIFKFASVVVDVSAKHLAQNKTVCCDNQKSSNPDSYYQRLQEKLNKLRKHKSRLDAFQLKKKDTAAAAINNNNVASALNQNALMTTNKLQNSSIVCHQQQQQKIDTRKIDFHNEITKMRRLSTENIHQKSSTSSTKILPMPSTTTTLSLLSLRNINKKDFQRICLFPIVYGSIVLMHLQIIGLAIALNTTSLPAGLIFLIGSLFFVAFITFKVFFIEKFRKINVKAVSRQEKRLKQIAEICQRVKDQEEQEEIANSQNVEMISKRQSRNRLKKFCIEDLTSQNLSKIKLL